ncbi:unnamed protein product [Vitrella brassicaformis CCMP3155]|uniref:Uncharacterized protein n=1 Tax=Vitrella brassicaformis (strain CCMP3155) TaxID=1169540 RepID=A0A0G4EVV8_VITBC|nr:unnamed protein product [Vitrella brassicaformis CCMP3155]|eukprot:CEM02337.1 unnamed protein product [Vitrella brassicaformis CCMP3155]
MATIAPSRGQHLYVWRSGGRVYSRTGVKLHNGDADCQVLILDATAGGVVAGHSTKAEPCSPDLYHINFYGQNTKKSIPENWFTIAPAGTDNKGQFVWPTCAKGRPAKPAGLAARLCGEMLRQRRKKKKKCRGSEEVEGEEGEGEGESEEGECERGWGSGEVEDEDDDEGDEDDDEGEEGEEGEREEGEEEESEEEEEAE